MAVRINTKRKSRGRKGPNYIGFGLVAASILGAAMIVSRRPSSVEAEMIVKSSPLSTSMKVPVPIEAVSAGTKFSDIRFKMVAVSSEELPPSVVRSVSGIENYTSVVAIPAGEPIDRKNLVRTIDTSNPVVDQIPQGMRAMTIRVDATSSVEGWAGSGSIVDVLLVDKLRTTVIAEKVKVLSAERSVSPVGGQAPSVPSTITLLVTQDQCLAINTAIPLGKIAFALRSTADLDSWGYPTYSAGQLQETSNTSRKDHHVSGFVSVSGAEKKAFVLSENRWVPSDVVPEGFLVASRENIFANTNRQVGE